MCPFTRSPRHPFIDHSAMRLFIPVLLAILCGLGIGLGGTIIELGPSPAGDVSTKFSIDNIAAVAAAQGPRVVVDADKFDFGTMERDTTSSHTFTLRNEGQTPLLLKKGEASCRCTSFELGKTALAPGESTTIAVTWEATVNEGSFRQSAPVETNDPARPIVTFTIEGKVLFSHRLMPEELVFSSLSVNDSSTAELRIYGYRGEDIAVLSHEFVEADTADKFAVDIKPLPVEELREDADAKSGLLVQVTAKSGLPLGPIRQKIRLRLNLTGEPTVEVPIGGNVISDVQLVGRGWEAESGMLSLGSVSQREGAKAALFLQARGPHRDDLKPSVKEVFPESLQVSLGEPQLLAGGQLVRVPLTIAVPAGMRPALHLGNQQGKLGHVLIDTGHPEAKTMKLWVRFAVGE